MKKILCAIIISSFLLLNACMLNEMQIKKNPDENTVSDEVTQKEQFPDIPKNIQLGETFPLTNWLHSGYLNVTIEKVEVYDTLHNAGITLDETFDYTVIDGINYDAKNGSFLGNYSIVMLYFRVESVNAISEDSVIEPDMYGKYDFRVDALGSCGTSLYFDKANELSAHYFAYHLEPGESIDIKAGYLVNTDEIDLKDLKFTTAATPENGTVIDLNLK